MDLAPLCLAVHVRRAVSLDFNVCQLVDNLSQRIRVCGCSIRLQIDLCGIETVEAIFDDVFQGLAVAIVQTIQLRRVQNPRHLRAEGLAFDTETETLFCTLLYGGGVTADTTVSVGSRPPFVPEDV